MKSQAELADQLKAVNDKLVKFGLKLDSFKKTSPTVSADLQAAVDGLSAQVDSIDAMLPEVPA